MKAIFLIFAILAPSVLLAQPKQLPPGQFTDKQIEEFVTRSIRQEENRLRQATSTISAKEQERGVVDCFDFYHFGSVQISVGPTTTLAKPGEPLRFQGTIQNMNDYPIVGGTVYAKVFRKQADKISTHLNGDLLVDQFVVQDNVNLPARGEEDIALTWNVPRFARSGEYKLATFFYTYDRFNLLGLTFTDDVVGNTATFSIEDGTASTVEFDKNSVTLNSKPYYFTQFIPTFPKDEPAIVQIPLKNTTNQSQTVAVSWKLYNWDNLQKANLMREFSETVRLERGETKTLQFDMRESKGNVSFLVVRATYEDTSSLLGVRFARSGIEGIRINFPSVGSFPLKSGEPNLVFSCLHSTSPLTVPDSKLTLTLKDSNNASIYSYMYVGEVTGAMMGIKSNFIPQKSYDRFTLTASLEKAGKTVDRVDVAYDCRTIDASLCFPTPPFPQPWQSASAVIFGLCLAGAGLYLVHASKACPRSHVS